ncbi:MAG TPA: acyl-CoA dehydrogenase C-terminal domain-containing protein [Edaphobacter sp.]
MRDARITPIYEGTNGIQALDLLARKVLGDRGQALRDFLSSVQNFAADASSAPEVSAMADKLSALVERTRGVAAGFTEAVRPDPDAVSIAANHFLRLLGHVTLGFLWLRMARLALDQAKEDQQGRGDFLAAKVSTARFYFERLLPEVEMHFAALSATPDSVMVPLSHLS